ncbi:MAG TPA: hypothetical protein VJ761_24600 [Ktedonobacteraceae bacterium]|nr:hypothetical protein [Ktedonobacteraceae bacterium]
MSQIHTEYKHLAREKVLSRFRFSLPAGSRRFSMLLTIALLLSMIPGAFFSSEVAFAHVGSQNLE